jgi:hypothetical protein
VLGRQIRRPHQHLTAQRHLPQVGLHLLPQQQK